ncbi:MAG: phosphoribosylamine--glycine ligase [Candidatus Eisenbacteria bacterium]|nr:phosphoribosylamine--glycine ligase [Candidatus Eisenbacteria bacterium]
MKILVVGGGGREHALVWKIAQSPAAREIIAAPGNAGIAELARCVAVAAEDVESLVGLAEDEHVDLVVIGPEAPLVLGLADRLSSRGIAAFGPSRGGARIEGSKSFAKDVMDRACVPTARAVTTGSRDEAMSAADDMGYPVVVKADGLAAGKGVVIATDRIQAMAAIDDALVHSRFGASGHRVLIEEHLEGEEASILAFVDGETSVLMVPSQDHKRAYDGDLGPNTGGMGAYAPASIVTPAMLEMIRSDIIDATVSALREMDGTVYRGVLYAGLMITADGPAVIEFNCRFGDPEAQVTLPLLDADIVELMSATAHGELDGASAATSPRCAAGVVMASGGYPGSYEKGKIISGLDQVARMKDVFVFHAGTSSADGSAVTAGGRVLCVTGLGPDLPDALSKAYAGVGAISFEGAHYRSDIGHRAIARLGVEHRETAA